MQKLCTKQPTDTVRDEQVNIEEHLAAYTLTLTQPWVEGFPQGLKIT